MSRIDVNQFDIEIHEGYYPKSEGQSHGITHIREVYQTALKMNEELGLNIDKDQILVASYMHDIYSSLNRNHHHIKGKEYILLNQKTFWWLRCFSEEEINDISNAIFEHRASYKGEYSSKLSELLSAADKGKLNVNNTIIRSFMYQCEESPENIIKVNIEKVYDHMKDKFSSKGYARYNDVYENYYKNELIMFKRFFDNISYYEIEDVIMNKLLHLSLRDLGVRV